MFTINKSSETISGYFNIDNITYDIIRIYALDAYIKSSHLAQAFDTAINNIANSSHIKFMKPEYIIFATRIVESAVDSNNPIMTMLAINKIINDIKEKHDISIELEIS